MAQSFCCNYIHLIFSTKNRANLIMRPEECWRYLGGIAKNLHVAPMRIGGTQNHVHLLLGIPGDIRVSDAVSKLKANSSRWMKSSSPQFAWQRGYGAFSVSVSNITAVSDYIDRQPEHHRKRTFEDEFIAFLKRHKVDYDPRFVFD